MPKLIWYVKAYKAIVLSSAKFMDKITGCGFNVSLSYLFQQALFISIGSLIKLMFEQD